MHPFTYLRPTSLDEACALLAEHAEARPLAGGMTLVPTLKQRLAAPSHLVDLTRLPGLRGIALEAGVLHIGAATPHAVVAASPAVREALPALAALAGMIGDAQVRSRGTIGGSLANNDPSADYPAAVLGLGATVVTQRRRIAGDDFLRGLFETALAPGEIVHTVEFPLARRAAYAKQRHPASGYALAGVFIAETAAGHWRVAVTGAGPCAFRWREAEARLAQRARLGQPLSGALDGLALGAGGLNDDLAASAAYRGHLAGVQARRALAALL